MMLKFHLSKKLIIPEVRFGNGEKQVKPAGGRSYSCDPLICTIEFNHCSACYRFNINDCRNEGDVKCHP